MRTEYRSSTAHAPTSDPRSWTSLEASDEDSPHRWADAAGPTDGVLDRDVISAEQRIDEGIEWTAHEIRGPLEAAKLALAHLLDARTERRAGAPLLRSVHDELDRLIGLVDPLLRCASGVVDKPSRVDLGHLTREAADAEERGHLGDDRRLSVESDDQVVVRADADLIKVAVGNLVRNALAYSPPADPVAVSVTADRSLALVRVGDRGPGVPERERERIFERDVRGSVGRSAGGGRGLGLHIARRIAEAHGGRLSLGEATDGAEFRLELPLAATGG